MLRPRNLITRADKTAVESFLISDAALSGYLAGSVYGGQYVQRLEEIWENKFHRRHAIACNSATSGLLAACAAMEIMDGTEVAVPALSMSATAAAPRIFKANLIWVDVDEAGCADPEKIPHIYGPRVKVVTSLFGHPPSTDWKRHADSLIIDNAQGILASYSDNTWVENLPAICVTSFNVHKQINAGEGGMISTDDDELAAVMRGFINHRESAHKEGIGLNLRMPEIAAVLVLSQLSRIEHTNATLRQLCTELDRILPVTFEPVQSYPGTLSGSYTWQFRVKSDRRDEVIKYLNEHGVSCEPLYRPLYHLPAFRDFGQSPCTAAERLSSEVVIFEICSWRYEDNLEHIHKTLEEASEL